MLFFHFTLTSRCRIQIFIQSVEYSVVIGILNYKAKKGSNWMLIYDREAFSQFSNWKYNDIYVFVVHNKLHIIKLTL